MVKPWSAALGARASLLYVLLPLALGAAVSCTTAASSADRAPSPSASAAAGASRGSRTRRHAVTHRGGGHAATRRATDRRLCRHRAPAPHATPGRQRPPLRPRLPPVAEGSAEASPTADGPTLDAKTTAKLQRIIDNQVTKERVAGLQVAVRLADGETWLGTAGNAEFSPDRALDDNDQLAIASVTKTFIAALILQLAEEGKVDLDATFGTYFRDAPRKDSVTLRQLLSHTSGIYNFWANPRYGEITKAWWENPGPVG